MIKLIFILFGILLILGCEKKDKSNHFNEENFSTNLDYIEFTNESFHKVHGDCQSSSTGCIEVKIDYPVLKGNYPIIEKINKDINNIISSGTYEENNYSSPQELMDSLIFYHKEAGEMNDGFVQSWSIERKISVIRNSTAILSFEVYEYSYMGGAHGNYVSIYHNYNLKTGEKLTLSDIIEPSKIDKLTSIGNSIFRKTKGLSETKNLEEVGYWFIDGKFSLNENFIITENSLKFMYNPYEIAPYAEGQTEIEIPYSTIKDILKINL